MLYQEDEEALERIENKARAIARGYRLFQQVQTEYGLGYAQLAESKQDLQSKQNDLRGELDSLLTKEYGVDEVLTASYQSWQSSHQPFHWFVEFHSIMGMGGFDAVIGNPPYLEFRADDAGGDAGPGLQPLPRHLQGHP